VIPVTTSPRTIVRVGDRRMSFEMQPCGKDGRPVNHGMSYANANNLDGARKYAERVLAGGLGGVTVHSVEVIGQLMEFYGPAWRPVTGADAHYERHIFGQLPSSPGGVTK
jgi:hypothetical protein